MLAGNLIITNISKKQVKSSNSFFFLFLVRKNEIENKRENYIL